MARPLSERQLLGLAGQQRACPGCDVAARVERGTDLFSELTGLACEGGFEAAESAGIGALKRATIAYFGQAEECYSDLWLETALEIVNLLGKPNP